MLIQPTYQNSDMGHWWHIKLALSLSAKLWLAKEIISVAVIKWIVDYHCLFSIFITIDFQINISMDIKQWYLSHIP